MSSSGFQISNNFASRMWLLRNSRECSAHLQAACCRIILAQTSFSIEHANNQSSN